MTHTPPSSDNPDRASLTLKGKNCPGVRKEKVAREERGARVSPGNLLLSRKFYWRCKGARLSARDDCNLKREGGD